MQYCMDLPGPGPSGTTLRGPLDHRAGVEVPHRTMATIALVFPGQGSQSVGMGAALAAASPAAAAVFAEADAALGEDISRLAWDGPSEQLDLTRNAQPALVAASIAWLAALRERREAAGLSQLTPARVAGHSMGQYSALVAAGSLTLADAVRLVRVRGELMQASGSGRDGAMAAVLGLDEARIPGVIAAGSIAGVITVANRNSPGQVVISGERGAVEAAIEAAKAAGARRAILLPVSVAAHSPLMTDAAAGMARALASVSFADPRPPLPANADAHLLRTGDDARGELVEHLTRGVDWIAIVERLRGDGVDTFIEVGPGKVLTGLIKRIAPDATAIALDDPSGPGGLAAVDL
jgi:[acyl-carrier-protein] S-malonyltransferase